MTVSLNVQEKSLTSLDPTKIDYTKKQPKKEEIVNVLKEVSDIQRSGPDWLEQDNLGMAFRIM